MKKELDAQLAEAKMKAAAEAETKAKAEFVLKLFKQIFKWRHTMAWKSYRISIWSNI